MTRIVFVTSDMEIGGVQQSLLSLLRAFPRDDVRLALLLLSVSGELLSQVPPEVEIIEARDAVRLEKLRKGVSGTLRRLGAVHLFIFAKSIYHQFGGKLGGKRKAVDGYDIAVAYNDGLATWYTAKRVNASRKIAFVHTDVRSATYKAQNEREIYRQFDTICFSCESSKNSFLSLLPEYVSKTAIIPNILDKERIRLLASAGEVLPNETGSVRLLTVGRLSHEKGLAKVPELLRCLKQDGYAVRWYIVGEGVEKENLRSLAAKYDVTYDLVLLGNKVNPYPLMASCDVYVQPSDYEGYCIALAEARTLNKPVLACDFNGAREQIRDSITGYVTGMKPEDMLPKLKRLVADNGLRDSFSSALRMENEDNTTDDIRRCMNKILPTIFPPMG